MSQTICGVVEKCQNFPLLNKDRVYEGDPLVIMGDPLTNGDLTQEYLYGEKMGVGIVLAGRNTGIGRYQMA
jgi:hypothetical protein